MHNNAKEHYLTEWKKVKRQPLGHTSWRATTPTPDFLEFLEWVTTKQENRKALDIGCGRGRNAIPLGKKGYYVCGIDISPEAIELITEYAKQEHVEGEFVVGDVCKLPWENESFTLANDHGCFHHIHPSRWQEYKKELLRVLQPEAFVRMKLFSKHCQWYEKNKEGEEQWLQPPGFTHIYFITEEELRELFEEEFIMHEISMIRKEKEQQALYHVVMQKKIS